MSFEPPVLKPWYAILLDALAALWTKEQLRGQTSDPNAVAGAATVNLELPTGYSRVADEQAKRSNIVTFCRSHLGKGYLLGVEVEPAGADVAGLWDCSELTQVAYNRVGLPLPDGSPYQYNETKPVLGHPMAGDLGFLWSDKWGRIGHVMVATGEGTVVHARAGAGVVEEPKEQWETHARFRGWRRHRSFMAG